MQIFISRNNEKHGPYTLAQIQTYLDSGQMQGSDPAQIEGSEGWTTLAQVPGVRLSQASAPPPPYQPAPVQQPAKKKSPVLKGCGGCLGLIVFVGIIATIASKGKDNSGQTSSPDTSVSQSSSQPEQAPQEQAPQEQAVEVTAKDLFEAYQGNEISADGKFKDKSVLVTGTIQDIGKDMMDDSYVNLETTNQFMPVRCVFEKSELSKLGQLAKGQTITVRGKCHGKEALGGVTVAYATLQ